MNIRIFLSVALGIFFSIAVPALGRACILQAPTTVTSGTFFNLHWNVGSAIHQVALYRGVHGPIFSNSGTVGNFNERATNVLGVHQYNLIVDGGADQCFVNVNFTFTPPSTSGYDIIVVIGQSNGTDRGNGPFTDPSGKLIFDGRIMQIGRIGASNMKVVPVGYWENDITWGGIHGWTVDERDTHIGFALPLARAYARYCLPPNRNVMIVDGAYPATSILWWMDHTSNANNGTPLYYDMLQRVQLAQNQPGSNRIVMVAWQQAEKDVQIIAKGMSIMSREIYANDLRSLVSSIRADLKIPKVPFLAGLMVPTWLQDDATSFAIKSALETTITNTIATIAYGRVIKTDGLTSDEDVGVAGGTAHFNASSMVNLGGRYLSAYQAFGGCDPSWQSRRH